MKVAIVHYWLVAMRGGEKVIEALCEMFPDADIYTHVYAPERVSDVICRHRVQTTFIARLPYASRRYRSYLPLMPLALEQLDLRGYDLVISSESGPAKGVITSPDTLHVCYCHSPMRYLWNMYHEYREGAGLAGRFVMPWLAHRLRLWDFQTAARVDCFVANSRNVAKRISKYYRRDSVVVHPPVDVSTYQFTDVPPPSQEPGYYLHVGELVGYKRVDLAIAACARLGRRLVVVGDGPDAAALHRMAGPEVVFVGRVSNAELRRYYAHCRALLFPAEEDFGIVPLEAMACGRPVVAFGRGGALETVVDGKTGVFFPAQTAEALAAAIERLEVSEPDFDRAVISAHAQGFATDLFKRQMQQVIDDAFAVQAANSSEAVAAARREAVSSR